MTLKKFVLIPVIIGVLACLIQALDQLLYTSVLPEGNVGFSWISFQSWAVYFLAGCTVRGGIKAFIAYMNYVPNATFATAALTEMIYCTIGLLFGYITICLRSAYEKKVSEDTEKTKE